MNSTLHPTNWNEHWYATFVLLLLSGMSLATAVMIGIPNNMSATGLLYIGLTLLVLAAIYTWKSHR